MRKVIAIVLTALWIAGVVAFVVSSQDDMERAGRIRSQWSNWPTVPGTVSKSEVVEHREDYDHLTVWFTYEVEGAGYSSKQGWYVLSGPEEERKYPPGTRVTVHYDPLEPQIAVIEPARIPSVWEFAVEVYVQAIVWGILVSMMLLCNIWPHGASRKQA